jgi:F0F1-type ATP synthase assembly protein I
MAQNEQGDNNDNPGKEAKAYAKYTGIIFQMIATIIVFAFIGYELDKKLKTQTPWITALCCLVGVCLSIFQTVRQLK